jgi:hypothetical protein
MAPEALLPVTASHSGPHGRAQHRDAAAQRRDEPRPERRGRFPGESHRREGAVGRPGLRANLDSPLTP